MVLWIVFAAMTAASVLCVVLPLTRRPTTRVDQRADIAFYKAQLAGLDDEIGRGALRAEDAAATQAELGRRLLASNAAAEAETMRASGRSRLVAAALVLCAVPAIGLGLYRLVGSPDYQDLPLAAREEPGQNIAAVIDRVESHLAGHPNDGRGFELIAPIYMQLGRFGDAARSYGQSIRLNGETAERDVALGQALVLEADGVVTQEARKAIDAALKLEPAMAQARYLQGTAADQDGDKAKARGIWQDMVDHAPADAPYLGVVRRRIAALDAPEAGTPPGSPSPVARGPAGPMGASIAALPPEQRNAAIRGMVDSLAARLAENGHDPEGWLRLVRAYTVLGEPGKARQALTDARRQMDGDQPSLSRLDGLAHELGLEG